MKFEVWRYLRDQWEEDVYKVSQSPQQVRGTSSKDQGSPKAARMALALLFRGELLLHLKVLLLRVYNARIWQTLRAVESKGVS